MYPEEICTPMRLDLTEAGFEEMRNAQEVDAVPVSCTHLTLPTIRLV